MAAAAAAELELGVRIIVIDALSNWCGHHGTIISAPAKTISSGLDSKIGSQLYKVRLDNLQYLEMSSTANLRREEELESSLPQQAPVFHGVVDPRAPTTGSVVGAVIIRCFETMRMIAATTGQQSVNEACKEDVLSFEQRMDLNLLAIQEWNNTTYAALLGELSDESSSSAAEKRILLPALHSPEAIGSWNHGFAGNFWLVGRDPTGNYVIPADTIKEEMGLVVYKIVGIRHSIQPQLQQPSQSAPIRFLRNPMRMRLCIVPWYGRLLYDSSLTPDSVQTAPNNPVWTKRLQHIVMRAYYQKGCRVIDRWVFSEVTDVSTE